MLLDPTYSDMTLIVEGERLPAHKCIVCPRSEFFKAIFQHGMKEAASSEVAVGEGFTVRGVKAMLHFLYVGRIPQDGFKEMPVELLRLSAYYALDDLKHFLCRHHAEVLTEDNAKQVLEAAEELGFQQLADATRRFINRRILKV